MLNLTIDQARARLAKNLDRSMKDKGLSDNRLSEITGINLHSIASMLKGEPVDINWFNLYALAGGLECLMHELIEGPPPALPEIRSQADLENGIWRRFSPDKYNILVPRSINLGPMIKMMIHFIKLDPEMFLNKENKPTDSGKHFYLKENGYVLTGRAIKILSSRIGIIWDGSQTGIENEIYDKDIPLMKRYKAVGRILGPSGDYIPGIGTYEWNKSTDDRDNGMKPTRRQQRLRFATELVETGAMNRAFYDCIDVLEKSFTAEEIKHPFIVGSYHWDLDPSDPQIRERLLAKAFSAGEKLYGNGKKAPAQTTDISTQSPELPKANDAPAAPTNQVSKQAPEKSNAVPWDVFYEDWKDASNEERGKKILELADQVGFDKKDLSTPDRLPFGKQMYYLKLLAEKAGIIAKGGK